ncbi:MAG: hypothetical protein ACP5SH_27205 [Syntrophobacteraceae bacterium]
MAKKKKPADPLTDLLAAARPETVKNLVVHLSHFSPEMRRECFDYLKQHVKLTAEQEINSEGEIVMALWWELYPDLEDMDSYGGGDEKTEYHVVGLIDDIQEKLAGKKVDENTRRELIEEVIPFIKSGNAGLDGPLYDLAYAACYSDEDWRSLAATLEVMNKDWPTDHARRIYRKLGDREKYLELRRKKLVYGMDYYDLATFYWDEGNREEALTVAEEGRKKGQGRINELRKFLSERALEGGDRKRYLTLQFEQTIDHLTLDTYKAFQKICSAEEWSEHEPQLMKRLDRAWAQERLKILMHRKEYEKALAVLLKENYPIKTWGPSDALKTAEQLESHFPEKILSYYLSGLRNVNSNGTRNEYSQRARVMLKMRRILVDIQKDENRWKTFAGKVKEDNLRRPAFQEEFAKVIPGWRELV